MYEADRIFFVSDGAAAIPWIRERAFPSAIEMLDWYHLAEALRREIGDDRTEVALTVAQPRAPRSCSPARHTRRPGPIVPADNLAAVRGHVLVNRCAIEHYAIVSLASSGPMEKAVDIVVARRFKARGMIWFRRGVSALVRLRLLRLNATWSRYREGRFAALLRPWPAPA